MATVNYEILNEQVLLKIAPEMYNPKIHNHKSFIVIAWRNLKCNDEGQTIMVPFSMNKSVQVFGTFGVGGRLVIEGSNEIEPENWIILSDTSSNLLIITMPKIKQIAENALQIRPRVTGGDDTTNLTVFLLIA